MKTDTAEDVPVRNQHTHVDHDHQGHDHEGHDHDHDHDHAAGPAEYVRLGVMALIVVASLTGWWRTLHESRLAGLRRYDHRRISYL